MTASYAEGTDGFQTRLQNPGNCNALVTRVASQLLMRLMSKIFRWKSRWIA